MSAGLFMRLGRLRCVDPTKDCARPSSLDLLSLSKLNWRDRLTVLDTKTFLKLQFAMVICVQSQCMCMTVSFTG